jgi:hypothetical protein
MAVAPLRSPGAASASIESRFIDARLPTLIAFAGMGHGLQMPIAEFAGVLTPLAANLLFVKDLDRCWYQHGIRGLGTSPATAAPRLAALLPEGSRLAGTVGTSSGGTGAIVFGTLLGAPRTLAFSPRTLIDAEAVSRWRVDVPDMPALDLSAPTADLRRFLTEHDHGPVLVVHGEDNQGDTAQAKRIADLPGVFARALPTDWHPTAAWLRDRGELGPTLAETFGLSLLPGAAFSDAPLPASRPRRDWRPGPMWRAARERGAQLRTGIAKGGRR